MHIDEGEGKRDIKDIVARTVRPYLFGSCFCPCSGIQQMMFALNIVPDKRPRYITNIKAVHFLPSKTHPPQFQQRSQSD